MIPVCAIAPSRGDADPDSDTQGAALSVLVWLEVQRQRFGAVDDHQLMVMHIVSSVEGKLKPGLGAMDLLKATFPAGTVSGAAKVRAMEIIDELGAHQARHLLRSSRLSRGAPIGRSFAFHGTYYC